MSDSELDALFKEAATGLVVPDDSSAWDEMAAKLDQHNARIKTIKRIRLISLLAIMGISIIGTLWYTASTVTPADQTSVAVDQKSYRADIPQPANEDARTFANEKKITSPKQTLTNASSVTAKVAPVIKDDVKSTQQNLLVGAPHKTPTAAPASSLTGSIQTSVPNTILEGESADSNAGTITSMGQSMSIPNLAPAAVNADSTIEKEWIVQTDSSTINTLTEKNENKKNLINRFSIKLMFAPDFSSVNFFSLDDPGFNAGVMGGFAITNRWSVYAGAISSKKIYSSTDIDKPYSSNGHSYPINKLDGDCRVLDIPVNVYYSFFPNRPFSVKAGLGISSYLMLEEDYTFYVTRYSNEYVYYQSVDHKNNEWFKVLNLSLVLQQKLSNRFYIELEPFYKTPLSGVGEGKVSLISLGAFINLNVKL